MDARPFQAKQERLPSVDVLNSWFELLDNGTLNWRPQTKDSFPDRPWFWTLWNVWFAGKPALNTVKCGYRVGCFLGKDTKAHRVIFKMIHGYEPIHIDHIDGNPANNLPTNLRAASPSLNHRNQKRRKDNKSGVNGVSWIKGKNLWRAEIRTSGNTSTFLGYFNSLEEAKNARLKANRLHNYTPRHGSS